MGRLSYFYGNTAYGGAIYGVPAGGGAPVTLLSGDPTHNIGEVVTFDAASIYYSSDDTADGQSFSYSLHSIPIAGGPSTALASLPDRICCIAVAGATVYFGVQTADTFDDAGVPTSHAEIRSVPSGGGAQQVLATLAASLGGGIAVDSTYVYWTGWTQSSSAGSGSVLKTPIAGGTSVTIASGQQNPRAIAVDASGVYWIDYGTMGTDCTSTDGSLWELAAGNSVPMSLASGLHGPGSLAVTSADVYWAESGTYCNVERSPLGSVSKRAGTTGALSTIASPIFGPDNLSVVGPLVYFTQVIDTNNDVLTPTVAHL